MKHFARSRIARPLLPFETWYESDAADRARSIPGDANGDGLVTFADFLVVSAHFGKTSATREDGDFNGDNQVTLVEFQLLAQNFGK